MATWRSLVLGVVGLAALATALPFPTRFEALLHAGSAQSAAGGPAGAAVLVLASVVVWPLLVWGGVVLALGLATQLPGATGRSAVRALRRVLPAALRPILIAGVGVTVGVGLAGCGTGSSTEHPERSALVAVAEQVGTRPPAARVAAPEGDAAARGGNTGTGRTALDLDWPTLPAPGPSSPPPVVLLTDLPNLDWPDSPAVTNRRTDPGPTAPPRTARSNPATRPAVTATARAASTVVVQPGDTLWAIAAAHLPPDVDDARIDRAWRAWYAANTTVIGSDPNLIQPGQQLRPPTAKGTP